METSESKKNSEGVASESMERKTQGRMASNVVLIGLSGCGKTTIGKRLAQYLGYGFVDLDEWIEAIEKKPVAEIFKNPGEAYFRKVEQEQLINLGKIKNHVLSLGGGATMDDENWGLIRKIGYVVWINTPSREISRRIVMKPDEIRRRPLLLDLVEIEDRQMRLDKLSERMDSILSERSSRYAEAQLTLEDSYSTPEISAHLLKTMLLSEGAIH